MQINLRNLGTVNKNVVTVEAEDVKCILYFSYETIVGIESWTKGEYKKLVSVNDWSTTTGKLLNMLEKDKLRRVPHDEVLSEVDRVLSLIGGSKQ